MEDDANAGVPYVIPMSFGYCLEGGVLELYFHCAHVGKKLDCIRKNPNVAFSMCVENRIEIHEDVYCKSGRFYASVVGQGKAEIVEDSAEKCRGLSLLMERQAAGAPQPMHAAPHKFEFTPAQAAAVTIFKITSTNFTGKAKAEK
jgi:nitroimidazol reductase NimA-like FMN-containing flavoprotein (pyridoxamine 5'-phosphate oxidase superfamily)